MLFRAVERLALSRKIVVFCGIPGVGKSLMLGQLARMAHGAGRPVHLLQWDVARLAFESPAVLARYPEVDGVTHAVIRRAAGVWARRAVRDWRTRHYGDDCLLAVEAPLVGGRFAELASPLGGAPKDELSLPDTRFVLVVPSAGVRREIEHARARTSVSPGHERECADAAPQVVSGLWAEVLRAAGELGIATAGGELATLRACTAVCMRARSGVAKSTILALDEMLPTGGRSAHDIGFWAKRLQPSRGHAEELADQVASSVPRIRAELDEQMARWFLP